MAVFTNTQEKQIEPRKLVGLVLEDMHQYRLICRGGSAIRRGAMIFMIEPSESAIQKRLRAAVACAAKLTT